VTQADSCSNSQVSSTPCTLRPGARGLVQCGTEYACSGLHVLLWVAGRKPSRLQCSTLDSLQVDEWKGQKKLIMGVEKTQRACSHQVLWYADLSSSFPHSRLSLVSPIVPFFILIVPWLSPIDLVASSPNLSDPILPPLDFTSPLPHIVSSHKGMSFVVAWRTPAILQSQAGEQASKGVQGGLQGG
jgi:hypothetical protein